MLVEKIKLYEDREDVTLTTYILDDSPELLAGKKRPAVLILPGGAYLSCSDREGEPVAMQFAMMGYHAFVLRYSVYNFDGPFGDLIAQEQVPENPLSLYPNGLVDVANAMILIKKHADEWLVDRDQIAVAGFSAGGHNAAMYATQWNKKVKELTNASLEELRPALAILGYPLIDYKFLREQEFDNPIDKKLFDFSNTSLFGQPDIPEELVKELSPNENIDEQTPPMFLWTTSEDKLVAPHHTLAMGAALSAAKVPFELHLYQTGGHGLSLATQATSSAKTQVLPDVATWAQHLQVWLGKHFSLPLEEKTFFE